MSGAQPALLFYCQHSLGLGHLSRSLALSRALAEHFHLTLLSGGALPPDIQAPPGVDIVPLAPLTLDEAGKLASADRALPLEQARVRRRQTMLDALDRTRPRAMVVELFPFGRRKFADELTALLERAHASLRPRPLIASSVRDILVTRAEQRRHDERACLIANRWFDLVLAHSDPRLAEFEESFNPATPLRVPVHHTGFVLPPPPPPRPSDRGVDAPVVVSAGGGRVGFELLAAAVEAHRLLDDRPMKLIAGPFLSARQWSALQLAARGRRGLTVTRSVRGVEAELRAARASVSQCGYNTALELLRSRAPGLVVPFAAPGEDEQMRRARRLADLGAVRMLDPRRLSPASLAAEIEALDRFSPNEAGLDFDGARATADLLRRSLSVPLAA